MGLNIKLQQRILDETLKEADTKDDDKLDYEEFLEYFRALPDAFKKDADGSFDSLNIIELCKVIVQAFNGLGMSLLKWTSMAMGRSCARSVMKGCKKWE